MTIETLTDNNNDKLEDLKGNIEEVGATGNDPDEEEDCGEDTADAEYEYDVHEEDDDSDHY